ncbi:hypothetical protein Bbelb_243960 [Branchiostoma belcheri]|nr:hypothetical protein Bbelb_243960 [Branchiostoma belcheri]
MEQIQESTAGVAGSASRPANNNSPLARVSSWPPNFTGPTGPHSTGKGTLQGLARCDPRCLVEASRGDRHALPPHCLREARRALPSGGSMYARRSAGTAAQDRDRHSRAGWHPGLVAPRLARRVPAGGPLCHSRGAGCNRPGLDPRCLVEASRGDRHALRRRIAYRRPGARYRAGDQCMHDDLQGPQRRITSTSFSFRPRDIQEGDCRFPLTLTTRTRLLFDSYNSYKAVVFVQILRNMEKSYRCEECSKQFSRLDHLKSHMKTHTGEKPYRCEECSKQFSRLEHLKKHMRTHTGEKPYRCEECSRQFSRLDSLKSHMKTHTGEKRYRCEECSMQFSRLDHLKSHMKTHTGQKPYRCEECSKQFSRLDHLKSHIKTHTGEKSYRCEECSKQFSLLGDLKDHIRTHTGEKPYRCEECSRQFSRLGSLKKHIRTHTGEKPYRCEECSRQFSRLDSLKSHMKTHTGEKPYRCEECSKQFSLLGNLKSHMKTHTGEKPYRCEECSKQFSRLDHLKRHIKTHTG